MNLHHPLEDYFKYHPPKTEDRIHLHSQVNQMTLLCCQKLFEAIDWNPLGEMDSSLIAMHRRILTQDAITVVLAKIDALVQDQTCATWAKNALHSADLYACGQYKEGTLMSIQQCRMFLNQGITIDSLA